MSRVNPFEAKKFQDHAFKAAQDLAQYIHKWDLYSGNENAPQLRKQLARFLKQQRKARLNP